MCQKPGQWEEVVVEASVLEGDLFYESFTDGNLHGRCCSQ